MRKFTAQQLADYLQDHNPFLLDVREPWEFQTCRIEGSELIPMRQIPAALDDLQHHEEIVVICHHGIRSRQVCRFLEQQQITNVINLEGGVDAWAFYVDKSMATY